MKTYWVYILTNDYNTVFYIGVTNNIHRRMYEHKNKLLNGFSKYYNLNKLVYIDSTNDVTEALSYEKRLKTFSRKRKIELIIENNPSMRDLYSDFWVKL